MVVMGPRPSGAASLASSVAPCSPAPVTLKFPLRWAFRMTRVAILCRPDINSLLPPRWPPAHFRYWRPDIRSPPFWERSSSWEVVFALSARLVGTSCSCVPGWVLCHPRGCRHLWASCCHRSGK
ncbi:hypothetical protein FKM82_026913 [Ascaphus truei]